MIDCAETKLSDKELEPCPFCGKIGHLETCSADELRDDDCESYNDDAYTVVCNYLTGGCGAMCGYSTTREGAREKWNKRVSERCKELSISLKALYGWIRAEVEHFGATCPDDFIIEMVEAAINKNKDHVGNAKKNEWYAVTKKEMWDMIQEIRTHIGSDGTKSIISDIDDYAESKHQETCAGFNHEDKPIEIEKAGEMVFRFGAEDFKRFEKRSGITTDVDE